MSDLAYVLQVAIVGAAVAGVLFMFAAQAIADYLNGALRVVSIDAELDGGGEVDLPEPSGPDSGDEWDRARDRVLDAEAGVP
ncbi:hypothetical protein [Nocardia cyriacigeorgica]|uniref:hypothetical protein n=1 Tax=Nocardia cyriacigeorgica TaxID=135487 RepID=UPI00245755B2|nr:hypothetical protein [Nocardia cyriacigeorgica]